ncbi:par-3 family cell polarity regulator beta a isoform X1 [Tachysurus ichikawai]
MRPLGLHVKGIEENSRTKREGIFEEDECIVQINGTELIDKSFAQYELSPSSSASIFALSSLCRSSGVSYRSFLSFAASLVFSQSLGFSLRVSHLFIS